MPNTPGTKDRRALSTAGVCESAPADQLSKGALPSWQIERSRRFHKICQNIEARSARGQSFRKAVAYYVWYYRGKCYHCEPTRPIRLSRKTLVRLFYHWRASGKSRSAFALRYRPARAKLSNAKLRRFITRCLAHGTQTYAAAHKLNRDFTTSRDTYQKAAAAQLRRALTKLFYLERLAQSARRKAITIWKGATL